MQKNNQQNTANSAAKGVGPSQKAGPGLMTGAPSPSITPVASASQAAPPATADQVTAEAVMKGPFTKTPFPAED